MKKFLTIVGSFLVTCALLAQSTSSGALSAGLNVIASVPGNLLSLQLSDTSGAANNVIVYDSSSASTTNRVRPAYTLLTPYTTNIVSSFTNGVGRVETQTNTVRAIATTTVAQSTNEMTRLFTITLPANGSVLFDPTTPTLFSYGFTIKTVGAGSYNATYITQQ